MLVVTDLMVFFENALALNSLSLEVREGEIVALSGKRLKVKVHTLCVHGDEATGVVVARGIRKALEEADIAVVPLPDMKL